MISIVRKPVREGQVSRLNRRQRGERGSVLTEFVLVAPVMLLIAGSALRFYQELQAQEIGITFAREVATLAYNRCIDKTSTTVTLNPRTNEEQVTGKETESLGRIGDCIKTQVIGNFTTSWSIAKPIASASDPLEITVEAYRCDIETISPNPEAASCGKIGKITCTGRSGSQPSSACGEPIADEAQKPFLSPLRNRKVVAKIKFTISPLATFIPSINSRSVTYEATV